MFCRYSSILRSLAVEPRLDENARQCPSGELEGKPSKASL